MKETQLLEIQGNIRKLGDDLILIAGELIRGETDTIDNFGDSGIRREFKEDLKFTQRKIEHFLLVLEQISRARGF